MSLDKAIKYGKEKRKPYRDSKVFDCTCRNHGSCDWCKANRLHKFMKIPLDKEMELWYNEQEMRGDNNA